MSKPEISFIDTHAHFRLNEPVDEVMARARQAGVTTVVAVGGSCDLNKSAVSVALRFPDQAVAAIGFDRDQAEEQVHAPLGVDDAIDRLRFNIRQFQSTGPRVVAVGEIGLDYHYKAATAGPQRVLFEAQLALAAQLGLPVIVHSREADEDTLELLEQHREQWKGDPDRIGVLHCFTGKAHFARRLVDMGFHISFSGIVTFPKVAGLRDIAAELPESKILVETDCPYLAPVPMRGKRNEPSNIRHIAEAVARARGTSLETVAALTTRNARFLYGL